MGQVYLDDRSGEAEWVTVQTGRLGGRECFVPLKDARLVGDDLQVPYEKEQIRGAPEYEVGQRLSVEQEEDLYHYYATAAPTRVTAGRGGGPEAGQRPAGTGEAQAGYGTPGRATVPERWDVERRREAMEPEARGRAARGPGVEADSAITRSEEELRIRTERVRIGHARLRKYVVTEQVRQTVPVVHEEVRIEREPITERNIGPAVRGPDLGEAEYEVVLHGERLIVTKETVPKERIRLRVEEVHDQETVSEELRKERLVMEDDISGERRTRAVGEDEPERRR
ncbi:uncharacterized protein (TIGR02271 family) [Allostreptomyces psammosilenae]|uniref:Uncharacterized protein (TIGR02271 family) n=1 Tax=Allostreptomyces psammosilenae TaxID=1892865 RepID=A0A852ZZS0_9ACTN|nr:uncharacterized protein (TIGR02271 family) [Allostreptomyces psammosilenae]